MYLFLTDGKRKAKWSDGRKLYYSIQLKRDEFVPDLNLELVSSDHLHIWEKKKSSYVTLSELSC